MDSISSRQINQTDTYDYYYYVYIDYFFNDEDEEDCLDCFYLRLRKAMIVSSLIFYFLTLILGVPGNAFVLYVAGMKMKRTVNTVGFINLAIADLFCCLSTLYYVTESFFEENSPYGSIFMCDILPFIMLITMFVSVFTLSLISLDRFTQVMTPVWAKNHRSLVIARLSSVATWVLALVLSLPFMLRKTPKDDTNYCLIHTFEKSLSFIIFVLGFLIPLICITTCYGFIAYKLGRSQFHSGRAFHIMLALIVAFFLCWMPYHIMHLVILYSEKSSVLVALAVNPLSISLAYVNSCLNPILYVFMGHDFKSNAKLSLRHVFERVFSDEGTQTSRSLQTQQTDSV
ncbi:C3a anaphylatoxin chemotactic receptor-like [Pseudorasbora parva]|uniref:C3a anaphylatoxin chemotactic receptor-like n=1 Tax=Pseudorasbora parva TaxID=51549 RepID=UPI00351E9D49